MKEWERKERERKIEEMDKVRGWEKERVKEKRKGDRSRRGKEYERIYIQDKHFFRIHQAKYIQVVSYKMTN